MGHGLITQQFSPGGLSRVKNVREKVSVSKALIFRLLRAGVLRGVKIGGLLFITNDRLNEWISTAQPWRSPSGK